jgi:hypothetical protein
MFPHDFRRLALAHDLLSEASQRAPQPCRGAQPEPAGPTASADPPDRAAANQD